MTAFPYTPEIQDDWAEAFKSPNFWAGWRNGLMNGGDMHAWTDEDGRHDPNTWDDEKLIEVANMLSAEIPRAKMADYFDCSYGALTTMIYSHGGSDEIIRKYGSNG